MENRLVVLSIIAIQITFSACHVRLDYPKARDLTLDFLDNVRTPAPCGMPKGSAQTTLISGNSVNISWHLAYPHQGGFKLELFDAEGKLKSTLTPKNGGSKSDGWIDDDTTAQNYNLILDDEECLDCTVSPVKLCTNLSPLERILSKIYFRSDSKEVP